MQPKEYLKGVRQTWNTQPQPREQIINAALGLAGEAGEVADLIKKQMFHGHNADVTAMIKELGDVLYYLTIMMDLHGVDYETVAKANNKKLEMRYGKQFSQAASRNRKS